MRVSVYTLHSAKCPHKANRQWRRCKCTKWHYCADWPIKQRAAKTRSWDEAEDRARKLEEGDAVPALVKRTVADAVKSYLSDVEHRNLSLNYLGKLQRELNALSEWARLKVPSLKHCTMAHLEAFRQTWTEGPVTRRKRQERLRSFFLYCTHHGWIQANPAKRLSTIKVDSVPTDYFTRDEIAKILKAIAEYEFPVEADKKRAQLKALVLLMRWSGLRLGDAVRLEKSRVKDGKLMLYTQKTGTPVFCPLPALVIEALEAVPNSNPRYFLWSGETAENNAGDPFWRWLEKIFKAAELGKRAHPHMLRHSFSIELLLAGVPMDQVALLLGHTSIKITEKYYASFCKARQDQLEKSVTASWGGMD